MGVFSKLKGSGGGPSGASSSGVFRRLSKDYDEIETIRMNIYGDRDEAQRNAVDAQSNSIANRQPVETMENRQPIVAAPGERTHIQNERARVRAAELGNRAPIDNQPSWGKTISSSLLGGIAQTQASMMNLPRKVIEGVSIGLDKVLPDFIYKKEMQQNDPIKRALDKGVESNEQRAIQYQKDLEGAKGLKSFVATGLNSVPQILLAAAGGVAAQGSSALSGISQTASRLIPFGALAAGGYAREAENEGADYGQQVAYGLLGGTAEAATEVIPLRNALNLMKKFGAGEIAEQGAKTLIGRYGKTALQVIGGLISEGAQEGIMSPIANTAKKITYKPNIPVSGEGGIIDLKSIGQDAYSGIAMSVVLGALGLPLSSAAHRMISSKIESQQPITPEFVQNELIPAIQNDTNVSDEVENQIIKQDIPLESNIDSSTKYPASSPASIEGTNLLPNQQEANKQPSSGVFAKINNESASNTESIDNRSYEDVADKSVKAYQHLHPELKPFIQKEADRILGELESTIRGKRQATYTQDGQKIITGQKKITSKTIQRIQDATGAGYADIEKALSNLIRDNGKENTVLSKKIELIIDDNLSGGVTSFDGYDIPSNEEYIAQKSAIENGNVEGKAVQPVAEPERDAVPENNVSASEIVNDKNSISIDRTASNKGIFTAKRGDHVDVSFGRDKKERMKLTGISHANGKVRVAGDNYAKGKGIWVEKGSIYPEYSLTERQTEKPAEKPQDTKPLSDIVGSINKKNSPPGGFNESDRVIKEPQPPVSTNAYERVADFLTNLGRGEAMTVESAKQEAQHIVDSEETIKAELGKMKNADLDKKLSYTQRGRYTKKDEMVRAIYDNMLSQTYYGISGSDTLSYTMGSGSYLEVLKGKVRKAIEKLTPELLEKTLADYKKGYEESVARRKTLTEGLKEPKTLEDFRNKKRISGLTPEEQDKYEDMLSHEKKVKRQADKVRIAERKAEKASAAIGNTDKFAIVKDKHSKTQEDVWVVKLNERLESEEWKAVNDSMKSLGGNWWRGNQGWNFKTDPTEKLQGDVTKELETKAEAKQDNRVSKLREVADNMQDSIDDMKKPRLANTAKRAREAASTEESAKAAERMQQTLRNIADAIEKGEVELIDSIDSRTQVETLNSILSVAQYNRIQSMPKETKGNYNEYETERAKPYSNEDIRYAEMPVEELNKSTLKDIAAMVANKKGFLQIAARLQKAVANAKGEYVSISDQMREDIDKLIKEFDKDKLPWWVEEYMQKRKRLERMGIETTEELKAYLREYLKYRTKKPEVDSKQQAIKDRERELIGTKIPGYFPTPKVIVEQMLDNADIQEGEKILEPSAGKGNIADMIREQNPDNTLDVVEWNNTLAGLLKDKGHNVVGSDFLKHTGEYDKIIMNPPFEKGQDMQHVQHAFELLKPGGKVVAIMSPHFTFAQDKKSKEFRDFLEVNGGTSEKLPEGSFKSSERPTGVNTILVTIEKPMAEKEVPSQFQGKTPESQKLGIVPPGMRGNISIDKEFAYSDPELEQQHKDNRLSKKTHSEKLSEWVASFKSQFTRAHRDIEPTTQNAEIIKELVRYPKIRAITADEAARVLRDIIDKEGAALSNEEFNRFERYVFLKDLAEEIEQEHTLPGLWTEENVKLELGRVKSSLDDNINNAVTRRNQHMEEIKDKYIKAMADIGFNVKDRFSRKNYFRHQVLEYMNAQKVTGSGSKVKVNKNRGFVKKRQGTQMAINEDYLQAEYEVLSNMLNDTETAKMLARVDKNYSIKEQLKKKATVMNNEAIEQIIEKEKETAEISDIETVMKTFNKNIAIGFGRLKKLAEKGELWDGDGKYADTVEAIKKGTRSTSDGGKVFEYVSKLIEQKDTPGQPDAALILKSISGRKKFIQDTLGRSFATWETIIPEGYTTWQPIMGKTFFAANSITDKLAEALMSGGFKDLGASDTKVKKILTMGQNLKEYVIPEGIAKTLDNVYSKANTEENGWSKLLSVPLKYWKGWVLTGNPRQVIKYNLRNMTGDLDGLIASGGFGAINPKYSVRAAKEIYEAMRYMEFTPDLLEWRDKGGFQTLLYANEIAEVNDLQIFRKYNREAKASILSKVAPIANTYFEFTRNLTDYREALMRYASYLYFKDQIKSNGGKPKTYGASNAKIINGLKSVEDKAYQLSKDALGAYDEITESGQGLRKHLIPFYSWNEVNFKRYKRIVENSVNDIKLQQAAGEKMKKSLGLVGYISGKAVLGLGKIAIRIGALSALLLAWNNLVMGDDEEELPENIRNSPHITLGRNDKGEIIYFSRLGSLNDILEWFGLDTLVQDIKDLKMGRKTVEEQVSDMVNSPLSKIINAVTPFLKTPVELLASQTYFPDWREPRRIRDKAEYIANSLGAGEEYKRIKGIPTSESYFESWYKAFAYKTDPKTTAYYRILDLKRKFEQKELGQYPSESFSDNPRSKDLYYFKLGLKYGDNETAKKYLKKYFLEDKGTTEGLERSLKSMSPIYGLNEDELTQFATWLTPEERKDLKKAMEFYYETVAGDKK
jgi:phospholipid N-methyltransferase